MMTKREVFEKVKAHLLAQGERAFSESLNTCVYRAPDGKRCAAGCLIADEHYTPELECNPAISPKVRAALVASGVPEEAISMVGDLQRLHDGGFGYGPAAWECGLAEIETREFGHA